MSDLSPLMALTAELRARGASYSVYSRMDLDFTEVAEVVLEGGRLVDVAKWQFNYRGTEALEEGL